MDYNSYISTTLAEVPVLAFKVTIAIGLARLALSMLNSLVLSLFYNIVALFQRPRSSNDRN